MHTTGGGIVRRAESLRSDPFKAVVDLYTTPGMSFPHAVIGWSGELAIIADDVVQAWGCVIGLPELRRYQLGWADGTEPLAKRWRAAWPTMTTPMSLFPDGIPNNVYLHVELLERCPYSPAQYEVLAAWIADIWQRYSLPLSYRAAREAGRLVGHEDVNPLARFNKEGGWDPGALREEPRFDWHRVLKLLEVHACLQMPQPTG